MPGYTDFDRRRRSRTASSFSSDPAHGEKFFPFDMTDCKTMSSSELRTIIAELPLKIFSRYQFFRYVPTDEWDKIKPDPRLQILNTELDSFVFIGFKSLGQ